MLSMPSKLAFSPHTTPVALRSKSSEDALPFRIQISDLAHDDLQHRLNQTRLPDELSNAE